VEGLVVFFVIIAIISIGKKIKKAMDEEAARANRYAEEMKRRRAGGAGEENARIGPAEPGVRKGSLQDLLSTLAAQAAQMQQPADEPASFRQPAAQAAVEEEEGEGPRNLVLTGNLHETAPSPPAAERHPQPQRRRRRAPKKTAASEASQGAAAALSMRPPATGASPVPAAPDASAFFSRLETLPPWQRAMVLIEVLGPPRAIKLHDGESFD